MSRKAKHNQKVRARILCSAGHAFRARGFESARIDEIMEGADLTRGAFYAHFPSKAALLPKVIAEDDLFLRLLRARSDAAPGVLWLGARYIFRMLLSPDQFDQVRRAWNLPFLVRDAALADQATRDAYDGTVRAILGELSRGNPAGPDHPALQGALSLTCGALSQAAASATAETRKTLLEAAQVATLALLDAIDAPEQ